MRIPRLISYVLIGLLVHLVGCTVPAEPGIPPNILFVIADDQSALAGPALNTPAADRIRAEGVNFTRAFTPTPSCTPARSTLLTGRHLWDVGRGGTLFGALPNDYPVFPLLLEEAGYKVGYTGKGWGPGSLEAGGWPEGVDPVGQSYQDRKLDPAPDGMSNVDYAANFGRFLEERPAGTPFMFWYGHHEPHRRFEQGIGEAAGKSLDDALVFGSMPNHPVVQSDVLDYYVEIEHADAHLGRMLAMLEEAGELENTIVVVTSDHGMPFPRAKSNGLYDHSTHIPLMIRWPGHVPAGEERDEFVALFDVGPTLLEAAGVSVPDSMNAVRSLWPVINQDADAASREYLVLALERHTLTRPNDLGYPMRAIRTDDHLFVINYAPDRWPSGDPDLASVHQGTYGDTDGSPSKDFIIENKDDPAIAPYYQLAFAKRPAEELYDLAQDPEQINNVAEDPVYADVKAELRGRLEAHLHDAGDPRVEGLSPWDEYPYYFQDLWKRAAERTAAAE